MSTGLVFYEKSHRYKLDGRWVQGVTTLIKGGLPNKALMYWSARTVAEYVADNQADVETMWGKSRSMMVAQLKEVPWEKRDAAAVRGTDVHALAERLVSGEEVDVPEHLHEYVTACVEFLDEWRPITIAKERPVGHRTHQWAGKFDHIARVGSQTWLIDWKTTASGIWPETAFQLAAYSHAEFYVDDNDDEQPLPHIDRCVAVWLRTDGYSVVPVKADDDTYKEFRHLKFVAEVAKRSAGSRTAPGYVLPELTLDEVPA